MCGLFVAIKSPSFKISDTQKSQIFKLLRHRGPDGQGQWEDKNIYLAHTRLKIIDLDNDANQPFYSEDKRYAIVYNGECYNYLEIRKELKSKGVRFRTKSDTEVILKAFIHWGESFIYKICGMFSIVVYDTQELLTYVWRDRVGIKPLYITYNQDNILLCSEIKPILIFAKVMQNEKALWSYFNLRFTEGEKTLFSNINEVKPGSFLVFKRNKLVEEKIYWDLRKISPEFDSSKEIKEEIEKTLNTVIAQHNLADTSVSSFLSGGVDSAIVAAYSTQNNYRPTTYTFSTGLKNDEGKKAKEIADYLGLDNKNVIIDQTDFSKYKNGISFLEDPIGDSIVLPSLMLTEAVSKEHKVVLSGEGADEIFSGYIHHQVLTLEDKFYRFTPDVLWNIAAGLFRKTPLSILDMLFPYPARLGKSGREKVAAHFSNLENEFSRYYSLVGLFSDFKSEDIFSHQLPVSDDMLNYWDSMSGMRFGEKIKRFDLNYWARNYTLHRLDRLSMANSVEARVPYFDHRLIELVLKIKTDSIYNFKDPKRFLRDSINKNLLPQDVIKRKKQAFYLPVEKVFTKQRLKLAKEKILDNVHRRSVLNAGKIRKVLDRKTPELLDAKQFQVLYNYELWCEEFLD